ncbi:MAG: PilZ domain-containing protein [Cellvibrionaceae bacterium]
MNMSNDDRRRFFRITDAIGVSYTLMNESEENPPEKGGGSIQGMSIHSLLESHNQEITSALSDLASSQPEAANAISALNKKLDTITTLIELEGLVDGRATHSIQEASISACGIAFSVNEELASDTKINLSLFLETSGEQVAAIGRVIDCQSLAEEDAYYLRVEFVEMVDSEREKLIQHIIQRQGSLLRSLKEDMG